MPSWNSHHFVSVTGPAPLTLSVSSSGSSPLVISSALAQGNDLRSNETPLGHAEREGDLIGGSFSHLENGVADKIDIAMDWGGL